jgi:hypothetical protein
LWVRAPPGALPLKTAFSRAANEIVLGAAANRKIVDSTEHYNWLVAPETPSDVTLSNDNIATSASQQSIIHVLEEGTGPTDETVDSLAAKFQDLQQKWRPIETDILTAQESSGKTHQRSKTTRDAGVNQSET